LAIAARQALRQASRSAEAVGSDVPERLDDEIKRADDALESVEETLREGQSAARQQAAAGTAERHLGTVDRLLAELLGLKQDRLVGAIEAYRRFVAEAGQSLNDLDRALRDAAQ
jgi:hypothetical protein